MIIRDDGTDPDVAIVPEDDAGSAQHVVEVVLATLHKRRGNCYQGALRKLERKVGGGGNELTNVHHYHRLGEFSP